MALFLMIGMMKSLIMYSIDKSLRVINIGFRLLKVIGVFIPIVLSGCSKHSTIDSNDVFDVEQIDSVFRFVHISDTHGSAVSIDAVNRYCKTQHCDFAILTGDVLPNNSFSQSLLNSTIKYLIIPGNHDASKDNGVGQFIFRSGFLDKLNTSVIFPYQKVNYWYKDFVKTGKRLRVIGLDQFELDSFGCPDGIRALMTQKQIDWFVKLLNESHSVDGIIVLIHMGFGNSSKGQRDTTNHNEFISELANRYKNSYDFYGPEDPYMIPEIIDAYSKGESLKKVYNEDSEYRIVVNATFTQPENNFIGYFGGHLHWDEIEFLRDFPQQLQCLIAYCGSGVGSKINDLVKTDYPYNFNVVEVDLYHDKLNIRREGASLTVSGLKRQSLSFVLSRMGL